MKRNILYILALIFAGYANSQDFETSDISNLLNQYDARLSSSKGSARYIGMAESMSAIGGDLSAVYSNPASLGALSCSMGEFSLGLINNQSQTNMISSKSSSQSGLSISSANVSLYFGGNNLTSSLAINFSNSKLDNQNSFSPNKNINITDEETGNKFHLNSYDESVNGYISNVGITYAANINDNIMLGIGTNLYSLNYNKKYSYSDINDNSGAKSYFTKQGAYFSENSSGTNLSIGIIGKITPEFRLGLAYFSPTWWSNTDTDFINGEFKEKIDSNGAHYYKYIGLYDGYTDKLKNTTPSKLVLSAAYVSNIGDKNGIAANIDFISHFNGDFKFKGEDDLYNQNNSFLSEYIKTSFDIKAGIEYKLDKIKLRAGYAFIGSPVKSFEGYDTSKPNPKIGESEPSFLSKKVNNFLAGNINKASLGIGYDWGNIFIDAAYQHVSTEYYTSFDSMFVNDRNFIDFSEIYKGHNLGKVNNTQNNIYLTLGYRF